MCEEKKHNHEASHKHSSHCGFSLISCKEYSKLASKKLDAPLSPWENFTYLFHKMICMVCRRYERQITAINGAAESYSDMMKDTESQACLSADAKGRMKEKLERELH